MAIASGAARTEIEAVLRAAGLDGLFGVIVAMEDVRNGKPEPEGYLRAVELLRGRTGATLPADQVLVFEDSEQGLRSARAAGMPCVVIAGTANPERLEGAAAIVGALDWSIPLIREMFDED